MIGLKNAFSGKNNEGGTMATLLRAKNKFKRKSRREQWMQYGAKFVHHRAFMYEHWVEMDEETKVVLESEAFDFDNVPADNLRQRLRFGQEEWQDCNSNGELMMGVGHAQDFFDNAARGIAESAAINMPVHVGWDHMDGREVERLKYLAEQEAVKREQHKAMDLLKKKIQPWHPCEDSNQLVLVPHKSARRAKAKMAEDYLSLQCLHPYALVRDLVRCSFVCTSADKVLQVFAAVRDEPTWTVMFVKNRFRGPSPANYRDLLVYVAMDVPAGESERHPGQPPEPVTRRVLGEVQIHHIDMLRASRAENGMHLFQYFRAYFGSATMSTIPVLVKLKILKKMDQVATTPADLENFLENFLMSGGRATKELARIWAFQMLLNKVSEYDLAERMLRHIIMLLREKGEAAEKDLSFALGTLTSLCIQRRQYEKAVPLAGEALALSEKHRGRKHLDTCLLMDTNAILKECLQQREEAMALYQEVLATRLQLLPTSDARIMNSHRHVAELSQDMRDFHASEVHYRILVDLAKEAHGQHSPEYADALVKKGWAILYSSYDDAHKTNFKAFHVLHRNSKTATEALIPEKKHTSRPSSPAEVPLTGPGSVGWVEPPSPSELEALLTTRIADVCWPEALECFRMAAELRLKVSGAKHIARAMALDGEAEVLDKQGLYASAFEVYAESLAIWKSLQGKVRKHDVEDMDLDITPSAAGQQTDGVGGITEALVCARMADIQAAQSLILRERGDYAGALALMREVATGRRQLLGDGDPKTATAKSEIAALLMMMDTTGKDLPQVRILLDECTVPLYKVLGPDATATREAMVVKDALLRMEEQFKALNDYHSGDADRDEKARAQAVAEARAKATGGTLPNEPPVADTDDADADGPAEPDGDAPEMVSAEDLMAMFQVDVAVSQCELAVKETSEKREEAHFQLAFAGYRTAIDMFKKAHGSQHPLLSNLMLHAATQYEDISLGLQAWFPDHATSRGFLESSLRLRDSSITRLCTSMLGDGRVDVQTILTTRVLDNDALVALCQLLTGRAGVLRQLGRVEEALEAFLTTTLLSYRLEAGTPPPVWQGACMGVVGGLEEHWLREPEIEEHADDYIPRMDDPVARSPEVLAQVRAWLETAGEAVGPEVRGVLVNMTTDHPLTIESLAAAAQCMFMLGRTSEAAAVYECLFGYLEVNEQDDSPVHMLVANALAGVLMVLSQAQEHTTATRMDILARSEVILQNVMLRREEMFGTTNEVTMNIMFQIATVRALQEHWLPAGKMAEQVLDLREKKFGECSLEIASCLYLLAEILRGQNKYRVKHNYNAYATEADMEPEEEEESGSDDDDGADAAAKKVLVPFPMDEDEDWAAKLQARADAILETIRRRKMPDSRQLDQVLLELERGVCGNSV